jgi:hypothetical protein
MGPPLTVSLGPQAPLVVLADLLQDAAYPVEIGDLAAHLSQLIGMERNLPGFAAGIIHIQNPLAMAFAAGAGSTGDPGGVKGVTIEQGTAQQVREGREFGQDLLEGSVGCFMNHLYRCYTIRAIPSRDF